MSSFTLSLTLFLVFCSISCMVSSMEDTKDETQQCNKRGLTTILFATGSNPQFCALLKTALLNEHNVHIVGWNLTHSRKGFVNFRGRERSIVQITPTVVATHVCTLCKEAVVLGADAFDTLFSAHSKPQNIVNSFSKFNSKFVWSAERYMWPKFTTLPPFVKKFYKKSEPNRSPYKYLNYGGWIGRAREACEILTLCSRQLARCTFCGCPNLKHCKKPQQDQGAAHVVFTSRKGPYSELDKNQDIFHPAFPRCQNLKVAEDGRVQIQGLSTSTHLYHFNGNSKYKSGCSNYYKNGWFAGLEKPAGINDHITLIKNDNTKFVIPVAEICPYIWQEDFTWLEPKKYEKGGPDENISTLSILSKVHDYLRVWKNEDF